MAGGKEGMPAVQHARLAAGAAAEHVRACAPNAAASARSGEPGVAPPVSLKNVTTTTFTLPPVQVHAHIQGQTTGFVPGATVTCDLHMFLSHLGGFIMDFFPQITIIDDLSVLSGLAFLPVG